MRQVEDGVQSVLRRFEHLLLLVLVVVQNTYEKMLVEHLNVDGGFLLSIAQQDALASTLVDDGLIALDGHDDSIPLVAEVVQAEIER